jgi:hypothetical protein
MGDLNNDGIPDFVVHLTIGLDAFIGNGDGTFKPPFTMSFKSIISDGVPVLADFNGDGNLDIAAVDGGVSVRPGDGKGAFGQPIVTLSPSLDNTYRILAVDLNGDGRMDLVTTAPVAGSGEYLLLPLEGLGNGKFTVMSPVTTLAATKALATADFNKDSKPDIAAFGDTGASVLLNAGNFTFVQAPAQEVAPGPTDALLADCNWDGKLDLVTNSIGLVSVLPGNGNGTFGAPIDSVTISGAGPGQLAAGDFNGDGKLDLLTAVSTASGAQLAVLPGNGDGTFQAPVLSAPVASLGQFAIADFNGDGKPDVAAISKAGIYVFLGIGDGGFQAPTVFGTPGVAIAVGDLNRDGKPDLVTVASGVLSVFLGNGDGTFTAGPVYDVPSWPDFVVVRDVNGDGQPDVITAVTLIQVSPEATLSTNLVSVMFGNGDGTLGSPAYYPVGFYPGQAIVADMNGDGLPDLLAMSEGDDNIALLLNNGDGTFQNGVAYGVQSTLYAIAAGDLNGDGKLDFVGVNYGSNNASIFKSK